MEFELNNIYNVDAYEAIKRIPDKSIDLIVTDPPYEIDTVGSKKNNISKTFANCNNQLKTICDGIDNSILDEFMRVMKKINIYIWCNKKQVIEYLNYFVTKNGCSFEIMVWCKTNPTPLCGGNYLIDKEFCLYFRKKGFCQPKNYEDAKTIYLSTLNIKDKQKYGHPTIKPLPLIRKLIRNSSNENDVVLDCFIGSGTTAVASILENRKFIGFEINKKYYDIALKRISETNKEDDN